MNTLSERLNYALMKTNISKAELARKINVKPQNIQFLCSTKTQSSRYTFDIANALGINAKWLATGEGEIFISQDEQSIKQIPLLNTGDLYQYFISERNTPIKATQYLPLITNAEDIIAIQQIDLSMAPALPQCSYLFIQPIDYLPAVNTFVLTYFIKHNCFLVREYMERNSKPILAPKNYELFNEINMSNELQIVGKVITCSWNLTN